MRTKTRYKVSQKLHSYQRDGAVRHIGIKTFFFIKKMGQSSFMPGNVKKRYRCNFGTHTTVVFFTLFLRLVQCPIPISCL